MGIKTNLKISRTATINIKNFESIKPSVDIEVLDVPIELVDSVYANMGEVLDVLFQLEQANLYCELKEIRRTGIEDHISSIINQDFGVLRNNVKVALGSIVDLIEAPPIKTVTLDDIPDD